PSLPSASASSISSYRCRLSPVFLTRSSFLRFLRTVPAGPYTLSLHDALPIWCCVLTPWMRLDWRTKWQFLILNCVSGNFQIGKRSEEHTSELQSRFDLVCRLLLEKKNKANTRRTNPADTVGHSPAEHAHTQPQ